LHVFDDFGTVWDPNNAYGKCEHTVGLLFRRQIAMPLEAAGAI